MKHLLSMVWLVLCASLLSMARAEEESASATGTLEELPALHDQVYTPQTNRFALLNVYFERIKDLNYDYAQVGSVLEAIVFLELQNKFPAPQHQVIRNLAYQIKGNQTAGELDFVVLNGDGSAAQLVLDVSLSGNLYQSATQAQKNLERFSHRLRAGHITKFIGTDDSQQVLTTDPFKELSNYARAANQGALAAGFEYEVDLTREEADELQDRLLIDKKSPLTLPKN